MELTELADRCHDSGAIATEVLLQIALSEFAFDRNHAERARVEAERALKMARTLGAGPVQGLALLSMGTILAEGTAPERALAQRFFASARSMLAASRRYGLEQIAEELRLRILEHRRDAKEALSGHERAIPVSQRLRAGVVELYHHIDVATLLYDGPDTGFAKAARAVQRARELTETLHLLPPSPAYLREWLLEGRLAAADERLDVARDRWSAILDRPGPVLYPRFRAEAAIRLAILEFADHRPAEAKAYLERVHSDEMEKAAPKSWVIGPETLADRAPNLHHGASALPTTGSRR